MTRVIDRKEMTAAFAEAAELARTGTSAERAGRVQPVGTVTALRQRLGLKLHDFAERYHIPIETLRGWERGTIEPDAVATALLRLIAADEWRAAPVLHDVRIAEDLEEVVDVGVGQPSQSHTLGRNVGKLESVDHWFTGRPELRGRFT